MIILHLLLKDDYNEMGIYNKRYMNLNFGKLNELLAILEEKISFLLMRVLEDML